MAILGFIFMCLILLWAGLFLTLAALNCLGKYTIGGVENSNLGRIIIIACIVGYFYAWKFTFEYSPFSLVVN